MRRRRDGDRKTNTGEQTDRGSAGNTQHPRLLSTARLQQDPAGLTSLLPRHLLGRTGVIDLPFPLPYLLCGGIQVCKGLNSPGGVFQSLQRHRNQTSKVHSDFFQGESLPLSAKTKALLLSTALVLNAPILPLATGKKLTPKSLQPWQ